MSAPEGPFRRDARVERAADVAPVAIAYRMIDRTTGLGLPAYFAILGLTTVAMALAMPSHAFVAGTAGVALVLLAGLTYRQLRQARARAESEPSEWASRCSFTAEGLVHEGTRGRTAWSYAAIRAIRRHAEWIVLELHTNQVLVVRGDASLAEWIGARATALVTNRPSPQHTLMLLAILYVLVAAASVLVLPSVIAP